MSRIIGQCATSDFRAIEHLADTLKSPEMLDTKTLTNSQKFAFAIIAAFKEADIGFREIYNIKKILFWNDGHIEFRFLDIPKARMLLIKLNEPTVKANIIKGIKMMLGG